MNLRSALLDALHGTAAGQPMGPGLERDVAMTARTVLRQHGLPDAQVVVRREGRSLVLEVIPPPRAPHVERIELRMG